MYTLEGAVALFFLIGLITVYYLRVEIISESLRSYKSISAGLVILAVVSLIRLYANQGLFQNIPYLADSLLFELGCWVTMLMGMTFLISGVSSWLPIARDHRKFNRERLMKLDLLRKVEQLVGVETRLDTILGTTLDYITSLNSFQYGIVCKYSAHRNQLITTSSSGDLPSESDCFSKLRIDQTKLFAFADSNEKLSSSIFIGLPNRLQNSSEIIPIMINRQYVGFFLLWRDPIVESDADQSIIIRLAAEVIARKIEHDQNSYKLQSLDNQQRLQRRLSTVVDRKQPTRKIFTDLIKELSKSISIDFAALSIISKNNKTVRRFSIGNGNQALVEAGLPLPEYGSLTGPAFSKGEKVIVSNLPAGHQPTPKEIVTSNDVKSLLAIPLLFETSTKAVLMIASRKQQAYGHQEQVKLETALESIKRLILRDYSHLKKVEYQHNLIKIGNLLSSSDLTNTKRLIEDCAKFIIGFTNADIVRISRVEDDGAFLKSEILITEKSFQGLVPSNGRMITSLMPLHLQAINSGDPVTISADNSQQELIEIEARQAFNPDVKSALIIPISIGGEVNSLISIASLEVNYDLFENEETLQMIILIASIITSSKVTTKETRVNLSEFATSNTKSRLRSSLSGIIGSVDLLKSTLSGSAKEELGKYLSIIDRSTKKLDDCINEEAKIY